MSLVSQLRRELGVDLAISDALQCTTVEELEQLCQAVGTPKEEHEAPVPSRDYSIFAIPRFWKAPVGWLLRLDKVPNQAAMRAACCALVHRHQGLRAKPYTLGGQTNIASYCNVAAPCLLALRQLLPSPDNLWAQASEALLATWPQVGATAPLSLGTNDICSPEEVAHFQWSEFSEEADLKKAAWLRARSRGFKNPASVGVLLFNGDGPAVAYLHIAVNHAVTDAACIVTLVSELLELHDAALAYQTDSCTTVSEENPSTSLAAEALSRAVLPPAPRGLELQEAQLKEAMLPCRAANSNQSNSLDMAHGAFNPRLRGHDHFIKLLPGSAQVLEVATRVMGAPTDHLLVAALVVAFSQTTQVRDVKLTLIVPMRDARGKRHTIANLASTRHMKICLAGRRSLVDVVLDVTNSIRRRDWQPCDVLAGEGDGLFLNVRGMPGFQGAKPIIEPTDTGPRQTRSVRNIVEISADQETEDTWTLWMGIRHDVDGTKFASALRRAFWNFVMDPTGVAVDPL